MVILKALGGLVSSAATTLFGSSSNGKGVVEQAADVYDRFNPSETTKHTMSIEQQQAGDASQESARNMATLNHQSWFDIFVDGMNRLVRPVFSFWAFGLLVGFFQVPAHWTTIPPIVWNIIWTIITFWFGARLLFKDLPAAVSLFRSK